MGVQYTRSLGLSHTKLRKGWVTLTNPRKLSSTAVVFPTLAFLPWTFQQPGLRRLTWRICSLFTGIMLMVLYRFMMHIFQLLMSGGSTQALVMIKAMRRPSHNMFQRSEDASSIPQHETAYMENIRKLLGVTLRDRGRFFDKHTYISSNPCGWTLQ